MKKVIGYVRVSSEIQVEKDNSIKNQINYIKNYCRDNQFELVEIFKDEGISGLKKNRDGLNKLKNKLDEIDIDVVVVYSLSRLGRKLVDVISWINELEKKNIEFLSIKENFGNGGVMGKLIMNILGSVNEFEVGILGERISDVKQYKKSKMEVYTGNICYGWKRENNKLIINNEEMKVLKEIKIYRELGWSYFRISNYLNKIGVVSKNGGKWYSNSIKSVLNNGVLEMEKNIVCGK